tara:strand:+ start:764 stop:1105 length:342 start_codon:yes stop_codon:yes gene_type:complete
MINPGNPQLVESVGLYDFMRRFEQSDTYSDSFSYQALEALHNWYEELADSIGEDVEFDYVGICCEWSEYKTSEVYEVYGIPLKGMSRFLNEEILSDHTYVIDLDNDNVLVHEF